MDVDGWPERRCRSVGVGFDAGYRAVFDRMNVDKTEQSLAIAVEKPTPNGDLSTILVGVNTVDRVARPSPRALVAHESDERIAAVEVRVCAAVEERRCEQVVDVVVSSVVDGAVVGGRRTSGHGLAIERFCQEPTDGRTNGSLSFGRMCPVAVTPIGQVAPDECRPLGEMALRLVS